MLNVPSAEEAMIDRHYRGMRRIDADLQRATTFDQAMDALIGRSLALKAGMAAVETQLKARDAIMKAVLAP
jgi:hypothetical protein